MNYYILIEDIAVKNPLHLLGYKAEHSKSFEDIVIQENLQSNIKIIDYIKKIFLFENRHIVSDKLKDSLDNYKDVYKSRTIFVTNNNKQYVYWEIKCPLIDCIENKECKKIEDILLDKSKIIQHDIFSILFEKQEYLIFSFEVAEKIMQSFPLGIKFKPVQIKEESV